MAGRNVLPMPDAKNRQRTKKRTTLNHCINLHGNNCLTFSRSGTTPAEFIFVPPGASLRYKRTNRSRWSTGGAINSHIYIQEKNALKHGGKYLRQNCCGINAKYKLNLLCRILKLTSMFRWSGWWAELNPCSAGGLVKGLDYGWAAPEKSNQANLTRDFLHMNELCRMSGSGVNVCRPGDWIGRVMGRGRCDEHNRSQPDRTAGIIGFGRDYVGLRGDLNRDTGPSASFSPFPLSHCKDPGSAFGVRGSLTACYVVLYPAQPP